MKKRNGSEPGVYLIFLLLFFLLTPLRVNGQDSILIDVITLPYSINTIASDSAGIVWLTGSHGLQYYDFEKETFITSDPSYKSLIIAEQGSVIRFRPKVGQPGFPWKRFDAWLSQVPPGNKRVTVARDKFGRYWVSTGVQLFIFSIEDRFEHILPGYSTRGIYQDGEDLYVNTYNGIWKNGLRVFEKPRFGLGEIKKIGESIYFAWGGLIRYQPLTNASDYLIFESCIGSRRNPAPMSVQCLEQIQDTIWVGTSFGLGYIENDSVI